MAQYDVYLHNIPKVSEDGTKVIPIEPHQTHEFSDAEEASKFAAEKKGEFERVVVIRTEDEKQKMVERYMDGEHIVPEEKEEEAAEQEEEAPEKEDEGGD